MNSRVLRSLSALVPVLALGLPLAMSQPAAAITAATISPDTFNDDNTVAAPSCADGHAAGKCTLRQAVLLANTMSGATIQLQAGTYNLTATNLGDGDDGTTGDLEVRADMTIHGAGAGLTTIMGAPAVIGNNAQPGLNDRIIEADDVSSLDTVTITDLKVTGGNPPASAETENDGGGIFNDQDNLILTNVIVDGNRTNKEAQSTNVGSGGGLASEGGITTVHNSTFSNNVTEGNGGGVFNFNTRTNTTSVFANVFVTGNTANGAQERDAGGGGIYNHTGTYANANFTDLTVTGNHATQMSGGGVYDYSDGQAHVAYDRMTLSGNTAVFQGGGFYTALDRNMSITNSTIEKNTQSEQPDGSNVADGGGIAMGEPGILSLNNDTIADNKSGGTGGGLYAGSSETFLLHDTLIVNNKGQAGTVSNCRYLDAQAGNGIITSQGHNIANDSTCNLDTGATKKDQVATAAAINLDPLLKDNGGATNGAPTAQSHTLTRALLTGSVAINTADNANCPATDQRGTTRPQQVTCDVGAYEYVLAAVASPTPALPKAGVAGTRPDLTGLVFGLVLLALAGLPVILRARRS
jgi:hypothetical protein